MTTTDRSTPVERSPKRSNLRLRVLLAFGGAAFALYLFIQLDRATVDRLGPIGVGVYELFYPVDPSTRPLSRLARRFTDDVVALGGQPTVDVVGAPGLAGLLGNSESFNATFGGAKFDDAALGRLAERYGDRLTTLDLVNTAVTDAGLRHLSRMTALRQLVIRDSSWLRRRRPGGRAPAITDAGMVHFTRLSALQTLHLSGLPITDAGLDALSTLPALTMLDLSHTKVEGRGLCRFTSFPRLSALFLDGTPMPEDVLKTFARATSLSSLSLGGVPLMPTAIPTIQAIPSLQWLNLTGCGLLDEEVDALLKRRPRLKVIRR
jgi:hypothetical protein